MIRHHVLLAASLASAFALVAARTPAAEVPEYIAAAIADPNRPDADKERDANRKPAEVLQFAGIKPGDKIAELLPGGGYFTRIISKIIGSTGHVYALVPAPAADAPANTPDFSARVRALAADPHYSNVSVVTEQFSQLTTPVPVDMVWTSQNYHDLHNFPGLDVTVFNQMVFEALKPGGIYLILDHAGAPGTGTAETSTLHRIDPKAVMREVLAAGFEFVAASEVLRQSNDPHTAKVFDPAIRGRTDQFIFKFRKPAKP
jgi:predicted methyltransferase